MSLSKVSEALSAKFHQTLEIFSSTIVYGGDINQSQKLVTNLGMFFLKENKTMNFPQMFKKEATGLKELTKSNFKIPKVISIHDDFLILEWMEKSEEQNAAYWRNFGENLAKMHQINTSKFGYFEDNFIGSLSQKNSQKNSWVDFFVENRLEPQLKLAVDSQNISKHIIPLFERLYNMLGNLIPEEKPSLLHGDLWNGNAMAINETNTAIFDPAVYYGHREMDLAMTKLFGGFHSEMYRGYQEINPLERGFEERVDLHNLYPILVHVNIFGADYANQVEYILKRFV